MYRFPFLGFVLRVRQLILQTAYSFDIPLDDMIISHDLRLKAEAAMAERKDGVAYEFRDYKGQFFYITGTSLLTYLVKEQPTALQHAQTLTILR